MGDKNYTESPLEWEEEFLVLLDDLRKTINEEEPPRKEKLASYHTAIAIGGYFGLHATRLFELRWADIINKKPGTQFFSKDGISVYFTAELNELIRVNHQICRPFSKFDYVLKNSVNKQRPISAQIFNKVLRQLCWDHGVFISDIGSHLLRKTFGLRIYKELGENEEALTKVRKFFHHDHNGITRSYLILGRG